MTWEETTRREDPTRTGAGGNRSRALIVAVTPVLLLAAFGWHPYIAGQLPNETAIAEAVVPDPTRWGLAHVAAGVALGFVLLAFVAIRGYLREAGAERWSAVGLPFVIFGSALYLMLPGMELAPMGAAESGGDAAAVQAALQSWFVPLLLVGGLTFLVGTLCVAVGIGRSGVLGRGLAGLVIAGLVVMGASRLVPLAAAQLYVQGLAALVAMWPLAYRMWRSRPAAGQPQAARPQLA